MVFGAERQIDNPLRRGLRHFFAILAATDIQKRRVARGLGRLDDREPVFPDRPIDFIR